MIAFAKVFSAVLLLVSSAFSGTAVAQDASSAVERFAGEARVGSQPPLPIHIELRRSLDTVTGTLSIPGTAFELLKAQWGDTINGRFQGEGGGGTLTLRADGNVLTGTFDLEGQPGTITAQRTAQDAKTFFRPPEQQLNLTTAQWLEDLDRLVEILMGEHASPFHRISREQLEREVARVRAVIPELNGIEIALRFRKLGALIGDGHTAVAAPRGRPSLPIEFYWFEDGLRMVGVSAVHQELLGTRLIAVNDIPVAEVTERLRAFIAQGETEWFYRAGVTGLINNPDVLNAAGIGAAPSFNFTLATADGASERIEFTAATEAAERVTLGGGAPLWLRHEAQGFWSEEVADGSIYVNWRSYDGLAGQAAALLQSLDAQHPRRLIIDLRDNDGGDFTIGRALIKEIKRRPWLNRAGVLYVLIGRATFSAAMTNAVDFKRTTEATLVGEPVGAAPNNWQEVRRFHLPNSGLSVGVSTLYNEFLPGEAEVRPDRNVPPEPSDWGNPQDASVRLVLEQPVVD